MIEIYDPIPPFRHFLEICAFDLPINALDPTCGKANIAKDTALNSEWHIAAGLGHFNPYSFIFVTILRSSTPSVS